MQLETDLICSQRFSLLFRFSSPRHVNLAGVLVISPCSTLMLPDATAFPPPLLATQSSPDQFEHRAFLLPKATKCKQDRNGEVNVEEAVDTSRQVLSPNFFGVCQSRDVNISFPET
ncbi:hypothetical protein F2P81_019591 [Scophthalmus maximus]|uniref:Uncharacterized protein n=1 Tax=Scophthalmus maximus TaxID=52904 RepID=A0A6A4SCA1_SCOMX|nr:hypothetical protein F2P81_019591 [Scophthalmus maximus]